MALDPSGILIIDKPAGWTSHDVVAKARRILHTKKIGHAGTLDPLATGVLVLLVGRATKQADQLLAQDKQYEATICFGQQTDTGDADGQVIATDDATWLTQHDIEAVLPTLLGERLQQVPAYSAVKVNGRKLYELARQTNPTQQTLQVIEERPSRLITIHQLTLTNITNQPPFPTATITIHCSKGTYIRMLAEELAEKLGTLAHLTALRRTASGPYSIDQAVTLEQLQQADHPEQLLQ